MIEPITVPDLSRRPFSLTVERVMGASSDTLYRAWTEAFDCWFAAPGTVVMTGAVNSVFFFEVEAQGQRHPHYGVSSGWTRTADRADLGDRQGWDRGR